LMCFEGVSSINEMFFFKVFTRDIFFSIYLSIYISFTDYLRKPFLTQENGKKKISF
jgi:hypothetical protein